DFSIIANDASKNKQITSIAGKMELDYCDLCAEMEHRLSALENLFKKYENMKEVDDIVDLKKGKKKGTKRRAALQPLGGPPPKRMSSPPPPSPSTPEPSAPVPLATRGTKRRAVLQPVGASPKRSKLPQLCPTTEPTSPGPVAARGNGSPCPNSMTARAPVLADKIIEAPSCNRYNLRPRKKLSAVDFSKSKGDKDHLSKSKSGVRKELLAREGDLSGSLESGKFMCDPKICPLTYLDVFFTSSIGDVRGGARKFTRRPPVPQNRRKIFPLDSITLMLM
ncbi:hypothetical protein TNCT_688242, partial [Trichonephila clavata]